jgi:sulfur transfer complex TusBCD TusB component (DsrH family)
MACQVRYLSSAGIQLREVKGVDALAQAFPINWLMYASLTAFPKNSAPIEIDLLVVMDDRVVLLELKDWNGPLSVKGDVWVHAGKKERSPVVLGNEKAKKIKGILINQIPRLRTFVDSRVVLTGSSTRDLLPPSERSHVLTLDEAKLLGDKKERNRLLGPVTLTAVKPNMLVKDFEKLFGNGSYFQPLKMTWEGYGVTDEDFYVHRQDVWREHRAQLMREERMKALLRLWRFDKLPVGLNEPLGRRLIADRELKALAYLDEHGSWMAERGILKQVGTPAGEVLTEHHQLLSIPSGWTTLRRYLARNGADVLGEQRVDIVHTLASMVAELHAHDIAHRDIGGDAIWMGGPTAMSLTGFFSATIPDDTSISEYLGVLGTYSEGEPHWNGLVPTAKERDVRSIGLLMKDLAELEGDTTDLPSGWKQITDRALAAPGERYSDARALADALGELKTPSGPTIDQSRLDDFETRTIPYVDFPASGPTVGGQHSTRYESTVDGNRVVVKVWNGLTRGDARRDHALLAMLEASASLKAVPISGTAMVVSSGLSPVGPFVVTRWVDGVTLASHQPRTEEALFATLANLVAAVDALHARGLAHGDLHPDNVLVDDQGVVTLIDVLDISPVGGGRVGSPAWAPDNRERCSGQQIDRFAVCRMIELAAEAAVTTVAAQLAAAARRPPAPISCALVSRDSARLPPIDASYGRRRPLG